MPFTYWCDCSNGESSYLNEHSKELGILLKYYGDVDPEELFSRLSSERKGETTIDLEHNANTKKKPVYKLSEKN